MTGVDSSGRDPRTREDDFCESEESGEICGLPRTRGKQGVESEVVDEIIARLARRGVVTGSDLIDADVSQDQINFRLRRKRLITLWRGVYLVGHEDLAPFALEYAALRFAGFETAALSDRPAAAHYRLLPPQRDPTIHLSLNEKRASPKGLKLHTRDLHRTEVRTIQRGLRITTPERTILDIAPTLDDEQLENVVADAIRRKLTTRKKLEAQLELRKGARGTRRLRAVLNAGPLWSASELERRMIALIRAAGLPLPESNQRTGRTTPDLIWREQRVLVELDSRAFHNDWIAAQRDRKRDRNATLHGWTVLRFTAKDNRDTSFEVVAQIAAALQGIATGTRAA